MATALVLQAPLAGAHAGQSFHETSIDAMGRAFAFVETHGDGVFTVAVVYDGSATARSEALKAAQALNEFPGPERTRIQASAYSIAELLRLPNRLDAVVIGIGSEKNVQLNDFIRRRKTLSVGGNRSCLDAQSCVLMVSASRNVEIVLDTNLAEEVGARFSTVFTMMVSRQ